MRDLILTHIGLVIAGIVSFVLMGAGQAMYGPALPVLARDFGVGTGEIGLLVTANWIGSACGVLAMYLRGNVIVPRHCLALLVAGAAGVALKLGFLPTLFAALVFGAGHGVATVIYNRRMLAIFGSRGPSMLALLNALFGAGAIVAPLVFVALGQDVRLAYAGLAALAVLGFAFAGGIGPMPAPAGGARYSLHPPILVFGALAVGVEASLIGLGPLALIAKGAGEAEASELLSLFFLAFLAGRSVLVFAAHRIPPFTLLAVSITGAGLCAAALALSGETWIFVPLGGLAGLFFPGFYVAGTALMGDDQRVGPTLIAAGLTGGISIPFLLARLMDQSGDAILFPVVAGLALGAGIAALLLLRGVNRRLSAA